MEDNKKLYLVVGDHNKVIDLSLEDGIYYQEVESEIDLDQVKEALGIGTKSLFWENNALIEKEVELVTVDEMNKQIAIAVSEVTETFMAMFEEMMTSE